MKESPMLSSVLLCVFCLMGCSEDTLPAEEKPIVNVTAKGQGFTGPEVPSLQPLLGDYVNVGVRTAENRTDINRLVDVLKEMGAKDYMHLVWQEKRYPGAWQDFQLMAARFQQEGIGLWLYLTPPSEGVPEPYGDDYIRWAAACAEVAREYSVVKGICIDDFNGNVNKFTPDYCKKMMGEAHKIAPHLAPLVVCYFGYQESIAPHVKAGAVDGVILPYFYPHKNLSDTSFLMPQIETYRNWLDEHTAAGGLAGKMPLVLMVYGTKHSASPDEPTPAYIGKCLEIGLDATDKGMVSGVVTYCLPKDKPDFVKSVAEVYKAWK